MEAKLFTYLTTRKYLEDIEDELKKSRVRYNDAYKQYLIDGRDTKLRPFIPKHLRDKR